MKAKNVVLLCLVIVLIPGCFVKSLHPFYKENEIIFNNDLLGDWAGNDSTTWKIEQKKESAGFFKPAQPGNAYFLTGSETGDFLTRPHDGAYDLMTRNQGELRIGKLEIDHMQIGPTETTCMNANEDLLRARAGFGNIPQPQRLSGALKYHGTHMSSSSCEENFVRAAPVCQL